MYTYPQDRREYGEPNTRPSDMKKRFRRRTLPDSCYYTKQECMERRNEVKDMNKKMSTNPLINKTINQIKDGPYSRAN